MCLVSYVPTKLGFVFSSNRDEAPHRAAEKIIVEKMNGQKVSFPADIKGGSWIFVSEQGRIICLLNGAFSIHKRQSNYRMSRGIILKSFFEHASAVDFMQHIDLYNIEPFTTIIIDSNYFFEFVWDGQIKHIKSLDFKQDYNWSSCTLYTPEAQLYRSDLFKKKLSKCIPDKNTIRQIHLSEDKKDLYNSFRMNRNEVVKTISFTQIEKINNQRLLTHEDLEKGLLISAKTS